MSFWPNNVASVCCRVHSCIHGNLLGTHLWKLASPGKHHLCFWWIHHFMFSWWCWMTVHAMHLLLTVRLHFGISYGILVVLHLIAVPQLFYPHWLHKLSKRDFYWLENRCQWICLWYLHGFKWIFFALEGHILNKKFDIEFRSVKSTSLYPLLVMAMFYSMLITIFLANDRLMPLLSNRLIYYYCMQKSRFVLFRTTIPF